MKMNYEERLEILKNSGRMGDVDAKHWAKSDNALIYEVEDLKAHYDSYLKELFVCGETDEDVIAEAKAEFDSLLNGTLRSEYWSYSTVNGVDYAIEFIL